MNTVDHFRNSLEQAFGKISAARGADFLLSPNLNSRFLIEATAEEGPSHWIVNRSDVYDRSLEILSEHPVIGIAARAREKLGQRRSSLSLLPEPPPLEGPLGTVPDYMIEDLLGHPRAPFNVILYFTKHLLEDYRASAALSMCRRLVEYPPNWNFALAEKRQIQDILFELLIKDPSPYVRAYTARIPIFETTHLIEALAIESHPFVQGRIFQNPGLELNSSVLDFANRILSQKDCDPFVAGVMLADQRLPREIRLAFQKTTKDQVSLDPINESQVPIAINTWYLEIA